LNNIKNAEWRAQREQLWETKIYPRLTYPTGYKFQKRQLQQLKRYYLTGKAPKLGPTSLLDPFPLVISLWLHPDHSLENWLNILEKAKADENGNCWYFHQHHLENSMIFFNEAWTNGRCPNYELDPTGKTYYYDFEEGFFLGKEKALVDFFFKYIGDERFVVCNLDGKEIVFDKYSNFKLYILLPGYMCDWLDEVVNKHGLPRYMTPYWILSLSAKDEYFYDEYHFRDEHVHGNKYRKVFLKEYIIIFFYTILHYPKPDSSGDDAIRRQYVVETLDAIEKATLPDFINHWWKIVKTSKTLEEAQERAKPRFKEKEIPVVKEKTLKEKLLERRAAPKKKRRGKLV